MKRWILIFIGISLFDIFFVHQSYENGVKAGRRILQLYGPDLCVCSEGGGK